MTEHVELAIEGMTCASCVGRVEKGLAKVPHVQARVNLATETAYLEVPDGLNAQILVEAVNKTGYQATIKGEAASTAVGPAVTPTDVLAEDELKDERLKRRSLTRLIIVAIFAIPVGIISMVPAAQFDGWQWVVGALTLPVVTWGAWPFHVAAFRAARYGHTTMDTLVSMGVIAASLWSYWALFFGGAGTIGMTMSHDLVSLFAGGNEHGADIYFEAAAMVTFFLLAGRYAEQRSKRRAGHALRELLSLAPPTVTVLGDGGVSTIPLAALQVGEEFLVRPGEKIATDGVVVSGTASIDSSLITGESVPLDVGLGDDVVGATVNTNGSLIVRATRVGEETTLAAIAKLITDAQSEKAPVQRLADRVSAVFVPIVIGISILVLATWLLVSQNPAQAFTAAVAVLIIACPCALGLATPTALLVGTSRGAQLGILLKSAQVLENTRQIDAIVLDKTGTITTGMMSVEEVKPNQTQAAQYLTQIPEAETALLVLAAILEQHSEHPIGRAIVQAAETQGVDRVRLSQQLEITQLKHVAGKGVHARVRGRDDEAGLLVRVGKPQWVFGKESDFETGGYTAIAVTVGSEIQGEILLRDALKPDAVLGIDQLTQRGIQTWIATGDNQSVALKVAREISLPEQQVRANMVPADKVAFVKELQAQGHRVAMVGDGVNDAAALAQADVGIAMGSGTDVAMAAADMTLMRSEVTAINQALSLSDATLRIIKQNLFWAFFYNVLAIPLAALGMLNPVVAGAAMAMSSVLVVLNSLRLARYR